MLGMTGEDVEDIWKSAAHNERCAGRGRELDVSESIEHNIENHDEDSEHDYVWNSAGHSEWYTQGQQKSDMADYLDWVTWKWLSMIIYISEYGNVYQEN